MSQAPDEQQDADDGVGDDSDRDSGNEEPTDQEQNPEEELGEAQQAAAENVQAELDEEADAVPPEIIDDDDEDDDPGAVEDDQQLVEAIEAQAAAVGEDPFGQAAAAAVDEANDPVLRDWQGVHVNKLSLRPASSPPPLVQPESLSRRIAMLSFPRPSDKVSEGLVEHLPTEVDHQRHSFGNF